MLIETEAVLFSFTVTATGIVLHDALVREVGELEVEPQRACVALALVGPLQLVQSNQVLVHFALQTLQTLDSPVCALSSKAFLISGTVLAIYLNNFI